MPDIVADLKRAAGSSGCLIRGDSSLVYGVLVFGVFGVHTH